MSQQLVVTINNEILIDVNRHPFKRFKLLG